MRCFNRSMIRPFCILTALLMLDFACEAADVDSESSSSTNSSDNHSDVETESESESEAETGEDTDTDIDTDSSSSIPQDTMMYKPCAKEERLGGFDATVLETYSGVQGAVANGVFPASIMSKTLEMQGCTLWQKHSLVCDPPCSVEETCDFDGACVPAPLNQHVGTIIVTGLKKEIAMEPREPGNNYFDTDVPHPLFDESSGKVQLSTGGGFLDELTLQGEGSDAIEAKEEKWVMTKGKPLFVEWNPPSSPARTAVVVSLSVDQHGSTPANLECVFEDTGKGTVPSDMIDALLEAGITGFPSGRVTRETVDSVQVEFESQGGVKPGCIDFSVRSYRAIEVSITGVIPCTGPGTCPDGLMCNPETFLCE